MRLVPRTDPVFFHSAFENLQSLSKSEPGVPEDFVAEVLDGLTSGKM